ncbi:Hypothetical protein LOCK908_0765 [Lacticaseibacillus rhamnosus LOCK908]|uniref:Uncharacterized protein n=2 Tax=Lacticaseibacillus rhamnosus TaxID=47715 RepID=C2K1M4_LACRM|nr:conserved hypothetical protein [Lacticaseibacillus rhamnosus ATCC 8530]AGP70568.1 Hypothetical protein LOCK900_0717 [Lacticaseibacillus rhamnosus LOCK900]AGP73446.1 Hypothetical protein LOCK908_0765 [Lacticaseibacillus rhamnosus LOCK908]EEN78798.1 hypothetical protein HMPREF0539_3059 [Lacticaseibacillus rhamnosus LMS2-1]EHJ28113.1 hypothetical protein HMPREF0541_02329 [Lacticaseibacillus rhamnosus ATCC 21052]EKS49265.1 hypothetical protein LRHMDP3_2460 [Lacticaseibacillus rhamnosus LRHMDP3]
MRQLSFVSTLFVPSWDHPYWGILALPQKGHQNTGGLMGS